MYRIYKLVEPMNSKKTCLRLFRQTRFISYEAARQYARKWIRKTYPEYGEDNPSLSDYSLTIRAL